MAESLFSKKWEKKLPDGFKNTAESMNDDELKKKIVEFSKAINELEIELEADDKLIALKDEVKTVAAIYKEPIIESTACIKYAVWLLRNRGK
jgi:hypothetical protein